MTNLYFCVQSYKKKRKKTKESCFFLLSANYLRLRSFAVLQFCTFADLT